MSLELAELNRRNMHNKKLIRFMESFVLLPVMTMSIPFGNVAKDNYVTPTAQVPSTVLSEKLNIEANGLLAFNQVADQKAKDLKSKADAIDAFYKEHAMPLEGIGMKMVQEAEKNGLDWRLLPAISVIESSGGKHACKKATHSFMGWGSCKINFESDDQAVEVIAMNLGGKNPNTDQHYAGKTTREILEKYNPPSIVPHYADKVMKVMEEIGKNIETEDKADA